MVRHTAVGREEVIGGAAMGARHRRAGAALVAVLALGGSLGACGGSDHSGGAGNGSAPAATRAVPDDLPSALASSVAEAEKAADRADRDATAAETPSG
ncbi:hypothetical protein [Embleya sp. AB8]|uniref:hypothetical protein n=1 Tax=Embleya sp. AB8 TaxID=3156304 RepID=UPI003C74BE36